MVNFESKGDHCSDDSSRYRPMLKKPHIYLYYITIVKLLYPHRDFRSFFVVVVVVEHRYNVCITAQD